MNFFGGLYDLVIFAERSYDHFKRSDIDREDYAVVVAAVLDGRGDYPVYADSVTAHRADLLFAVFVEEFGI